ncbi:methenyltetrahydromethanopterin cyclohydrolase [Methylocella sp.]|uniref:methenyltetrahydromethanopterin cyclohydrolase n=1 Tax=Methylocella sp. TaxID=1978226 RepID=UPI003782DD3A
MSQPSINALTGALVDAMVADAARLRVAVSTGSRGETVIDAGKSVPGSIEAGLRLAEICLGGLGTVTLSPTRLNPKWPFELAVRTTDPVVACLASQYAGWALSHGEGKGAFFALGSGPGRALACKEPLFNDLAYRDRAERATLVLESECPPPPEVVDKVAAACGVAPEKLAFIFAPTQSLAGGVQVVARVLEVAMHKAHELHFPLERVVDGLACAPLSPPHPKFVEAMGRTNDAIIYGGQVHLFVTGADDDAQALAEKLPSVTSRDFGRPFAEIFKAYKGNFYDIDPMLFSPAEAIVTAVDSGRSFRGGGVDHKHLDASFA